MHPIVWYMSWNIMIFIQLYDICLEISWHSSHCMIHKSWTIMILILLYDTCGLKYHDIHNISSRLEISWHLFHCMTHKSWNIMIFISLYDTCILTYHDIYPIVWYKCLEIWNLSHCMILKIFSPLLDLVCPHSISPSNSPCPPRDRTGKYPLKIKIREV